jgi:protoporphyrinogen oxidase
MNKQQSDESKEMKQKVALIIGAGPAGLTAAYELLLKTDIKPVVFEATGDIGGISKTVNHKGNRIDIGGHRFFSKSDSVMNWWLEFMPVQGAPARDDRLLERSLPLSENPGAPDPEKADMVMLVRQRLSRIFYLRKFFNYPITFSTDTLANLGAAKVARIGASYLIARLVPIRQEKSLEDFFINRFGRELYLTFFKDYTEKVWGVPCSTIRPEWGAQRIKGLSVTTAILHALRKAPERDAAIAQKGLETSLIERFLYPKFGPGQMWEAVARRITELGGEIHLNSEVVALHRDGAIMTGVTVRKPDTGVTSCRYGEYVFSSMPVRDLIAAIEGEVPEVVRKTAHGLMYRDFMTVGLLLKRLKIRNTTSGKTVNDIVPDNWIYIQERDVKLGRLQIFNNWSPYMVRDPETVWIGLEYFCSEGDEYWTMADGDFTAFAIAELAKIDIIDADAVLDSVVIRMPKAYPAYFGSYDDFHLVREFTDTIPNLFLVGRNGMHKYNNADHSMMTAMVAVENIRNGISTKDNIWAVNTEEVYHEATNADGSGT